MSLDKQFRIEFFTGQYGLESKEKLSNYFIELLDGCPVIPIGEYKYEIRELKKNKIGDLYGVFAKFRNENLPHIGEPGKPAERPIDIKPYERLIEKNYFIYERKYELLTFQSNRNASNTTRLSDYLGNHFNDIVLFHPIIMPDPMQRLLSNNLKPKKLTLSCARPNHAMYSVNKVGFSKPIMDVLANSGGHNINITISAGRKGFTSNVKAWIDKVLGEIPEEINIARMDVEDKGVQYPIDLLTDRLKTVRIVKMNGKYPDPHDMIAKLREARAEQEPIIKHLFGD